MASDLWYQLPPDMNSWNTVVMETLSRKIPEASKYISGITWSNLDPSTGDGDGLIAMMNGLASAPITIRGNRLAPIDVLVTKSAHDVKFYPLSEFFLQKIYADNVIGQTTDNSTEIDMDEEGPAYKVKHINTVNSVKYASVKTAQDLFETITKKASVANWMVDQMPETFLAIYERATAKEQEKVASLTMPDLVIAQKVGDNYYLNNELADAETVGSFLKLAGATDRNTTMLMNGVPFVYDMREKVANIHIPTEQELTAADVETAIFADNGIIAPDDAPESIDYNIEDSGVRLTTAYLRNGDQLRGIVIDASRMGNGLSDIFVESQHRGAPATPTQTDPSIEMYGDTYYNTHSHADDHRELFISEQGYCVQESIKTGVRTPISIKMLKDMSETSTLSIGMVGIFLPNDGDTYYLHDTLFGRIDNVINIGSRNKVLVYDLVNHKQVMLDMRDKDFYECNGDRVPALRAIDPTPSISATGIVGRVVQNSEGDYVIEDTAVSELNVPYALMSKYAASYEDAVAILKVAKVGGSCVFEIVKSAADDTPAKDKKGTKSGTDDQSSSGSMTNQTPETAMSQPFVPSAKYVTDQEPNFFADQGAGQRQGELMSQAGQRPVVSDQMPVTPKDLDNVVNLNDSQVMDAYLMSNLAANDMTSQETLAKASDSIVDALSRLSQLLFLVRQGSLSYISEADVQIAMNKLNDVAQSLGINPMSIGTTA